MNSNTKKIDFNLSKKDAKIYNTNLLSLLLEEKVIRFRLVGVFGFSTKVWEREKVF